eukprot:gnl/TRDRNA2_/TRDRNA2_126612_c1_seq1.p1 gnl/TRDRNA2_/TRDRNA2_126612_c1~~gnl/TRDRNA2_/TRDRNA2_126612_c1_seq1.p1  ORF type:complete len:376 (+),score=60.80 gnl/TRDRNA2_/TRDRNA2_126612_c1_seq1:76-1128(+)
MEAEEASGDENENEAECEVGKKRLGPRHFDVVGDVVLLHSAPALAERGQVGEAILKEVRRARVVAVRCGALGDPDKPGAEHRAPGQLEIIAGAQRKPVMTTHTEFGVRIVVDLEASFFSTRMATERQRLCKLVRPGERIFVPFAGCGPETLQLAARTEAAEVRAVELNPFAVRCARRGVELLRKSSPEAAGRVSVVEGDVRVIAPGTPRACFDRIVAPRPKGRGDGQQDGGHSTGENESDFGADFLQRLLPLLRDGGVCHWYDFAADWELPSCERTRAFVSELCLENGFGCEIHRCAPSNRKSIAERQHRIVIDFDVRRLSDTLGSSQVVASSSKSDQAQRAADDGHNDT